ncbi:MAG: hypothetical protein A2651_03580 [Candidatus Yanofskybacteria bacterium RIFCSPHIGHO2_01_FULL_42_12]|uniref:Uncharacterized protein n=1 Tax=Candidatus Yanofskybacteria bacterium RIFCSPLOWO2_01_FULL_42_49 TaxID=1802694 RepID=A0A1F8GCM7_9BACT|nr:MAG: hypothetical protein A2651_03580 [Candidatus Yanofskybacteria bacterium RIFCSPHIGHO2_01_FULL_42_12]OGN22498.1 MAG: hypothetical protein A2918_01920 [Candidatus Yanofskybacteria bacterium RIFCSPLOWO2_01_FULL_42_49]
MWHLFLFFVVAGALGAGIGYVAETSFSATTEVLIGVGMLVLASVIVRVVWTFVRPCFKAIDEAVRFGEESAGQ